MSNESFNQDYWSRNIRAFSGFYDERSEEAIHAPWGLKQFYRAVLFPIEKRFMRKRFEIVSRYIAETVRPGMKVADIGCGCGIFTKQMLDQGATVYAIDYVQESLDLVRERLTPEERESVEFRLQDITAEAIPQVDAAISIGVLTYVPSFETYLDNILPFTDSFLFNFLESDQILNRLRQSVPMLDVRRLSYHRRGDLESALRERGFSICAEEKLATGRVLTTARNSESGSGRATHTPAA